MSAYSRGRLAAKYLQYRFSAANAKGHGIHSPFLYRFVREVLNGPRQHPAFEAIAGLRKRLRRDSRVVAVADFGGGAAGTLLGERSVAALARTAAVTPRFGRLLFYLAAFVRPARILELGTSLGFSAAYLASGAPDAAMITAEGAPAIAGLASGNLQALGLARVEVVTGRFEDELPAILRRFQPVDLAFVDGNHRLEPVLAYFEQLRAAAGDEQTIVVHDIHWSAGMEAAWEAIRARDEIMLTVDLFSAGIVFFRKEFRVKQHFVISI